MTLQALDPLYVDFYLPQQALANIKVGQTVAVHVDTWPGENFGGKISAINPQVDTSSRNVQIRATLRNPDHRLLPGMFATLDISTGAQQRNVTLPQTAVAYNPYGDTVYRRARQGQGRTGQAATDRAADLREVGDTRGDQVAILKGIKAGDVIVSAGQIKLHNGAPVVINNTVQPTDNPHPNVADNSGTAAMNFTDIFIRRPVLATVVSLMILVLGLRAMGALPVLQYPRTENAVVTVTTVLYGAAPAVVAGFITTPLENAIAQANGIDYMTSNSQSGTSTITVTCG